LIEKNLAESDAYNGGIANAIEYYKSRIQDIDIPLSGCVWEAYYISHRPPPKSNAIKRVLERRLKELERGRLRTFFQSAADALPSPIGQNAPSAAGPHDDEVERLGYLHAVSLVSRPNADTLITAGEWHGRGILGPLNGCDKLRCETLRSRG
jgi:hypothetical protein